MVKPKTLEEKIAIGKKAFELYLASGCHNNLLEAYANDLGITLADLKTNYLNYYKNRSVHPKPTNEELIIYQNSILKNNQQPEKNQVDERFIKELLSKKFAKEIIDFINESEYTIGQIFTKIKEYITIHPQGENYIQLFKINSFIKECLNDGRITKQSSSKINEGERILKLIREIIIKLLMDDSLSFHEILSEYNEIDYQTFNQYLTILKKGNAQDQELVELLINKLTEKQRNSEEVVIKMIEQIKLLQATRHAFTITEYYLISDIEPKKLLHHAYNMYKNQKLTKIAFLSLYQALSNLEINKQEDNNLSKAA